MRHRHLNHEHFTLAAIDDVIARGKRQDWMELRSAVLAERSVAGRVLRVCEPQVRIRTHSVITSGSGMPSDALPDWDRVLSAAAHLQRIIPDAVLVGGTASAAYARHRLSQDADHVVGDLRQRFDEILAQLESVAGWQTARVKRPVMILGSLDGIETGVRQLIRTVPLETTQIEYAGQRITLPTEAEIMRIKAALILKRNATRDYLDFVALANRLGDARVIEAFRNFDNLYPQDNDQSALLQLQIQLANPLPFDLDDMQLAEYKLLDPRWHDWAAVRAVCQSTAELIFDQIVSGATPGA